MSEWRDTVAAHRQRTRAAIIEAALALLAERGAAGVSMSALAERAGVSRPTLYKHFPDLDHVLAAWVGEQIDRTHAALVDDLAAVADPLARVDHWIRAQLHAFAGESHRFGVEHLDASVHPQLMATIHAKAAELRGLLEHALAEGAAAGALRRDLDPTMVAELVHHILSGLRRAVAQGERDPDAAADAVTTMVLEGIRAPLPAGDDGSPPSRSA